MSNGGNSKDSMLLMSSCFSGGGGGRDRVGGGPRRRMDSSFGRAHSGALRPDDETENAVAGMLKLRPPILFGLNSGGGGGSGITRSGISSGPSCGRFGRTGLIVVPGFEGVVVVEVDAPTAEILARGNIGSTIFVVTALP